MNARLKALPGHRLAFGPRRLARWGFAFVFVLLAAALLGNWDPSRDLGVARLPANALYLLLTAGSLAGALLSRRIVFDRGRGKAVRETRLAAWTLSAEARPMPRNASIRVRREGEGAGRSYVLEAAGEGEAVRIEAGPFRTALEPAGREIAAYLGVPFLPPVDNRPCAPLH